MERASPLVSRPDIIAAGWVPRYQPLGDADSQDPWRSAIERLNKVDGWVVAADRVPAGVGQSAGEWVATWDPSQAPAVERPICSAWLRAVTAHQASGGRLYDVPPLVVAAVAFDAFSLRECSLVQHLSHSGLEVLSVALPLSWRYYLHGAAAFADLFVGKPKQASSYVEAARSMLSTADTDQLSPSRWIDPLTCSLPRRCYRLLRNQLLTGREMVPGSIDICTRLLELELDLNSDRSESLSLLAEEGRALGFLWDRDHRARRTDPQDIEAFLTVLTQADEDWPYEDTLGACFIALADLGSERTTSGEETNVLVHALRCSPPTDVFFSTPASAELIVQVALPHLGEEWANTWAEKLLCRCSPDSPDFHLVDQYLKLIT